MLVLDKKTFDQGIKQMASFFEFTHDEVYLQITYDALESQITKPIFIKTIKSILLTTTKDQWNTAYGFKGRPALADWINAFVPAKVERTIYEKCRITGASLARIKLEFPQDYLEELEKLQQERGKFEDRKALNKKNSQPYID